MILLLLTILLLLIPHYFTSVDADSNISCCLVLLPLLHKVSWFWFIVRRARRQTTTSFVQMPPRASITALTLMSNIRYYIMYYIEYLYIKYKRRLITEKK
jgi:hypothetical protein